jgi:hypothetical protein
MGTELHSFVGNAPKVAEAPDLETAGVGQHRSLPTYESVKASTRRDGLYAGSKPKVVRVSEDYLSVEFFQRFEPDAFDRPERAHGHEDGSFDHAATCLQETCARFTVVGKQLKGD